MKTGDDMFNSIVMPGVTVKSRAYFPGIESSDGTQQPQKQYTNPRNVQATKEIFSSTQSQKGFYTWLSSPKAMYNNRKMQNVAVITPTQHYP